MFIVRLFSTANKTESLSSLRRVLTAKTGYSANLPPLHLKQSHKSTTSPTIKPPPAAIFTTSTNRDILQHLSAILTKRGNRGEPIVAQAQRQLQLRYGVINPIQVAIEAIRPVVKYYKSKAQRQYLPIALFPKASQSMALRWVVEAAGNRTYIGGRPDLVRGIVDEFKAVIDGNSSLYTKKINTHRNPN